MKVGIITQARMGSTRLRGKVLMDIAGKKLLDHHMDRAKQSKKADIIVVAIPDTKTDDELYDYCRKKGYHVFRGSENNVLDRYVKTAFHYGIDIIVRITSDNPLIDPKLIDEAIDSHKSTDADLTTTMDIKDGKITNFYPRGTSVWVMNTKTLAEINNKELETHEREHVHPYYFAHRSEYKITILRPDFEIPGGFTITVDTPEDVKYIEELLKNLPKKDDITIKEIADFISKNPQIMKINMHVKRKQLRE